MTHNGIASIVRALAQRVDPGRLLREVVDDAQVRTGVAHVLLAAVVEGNVTPLVAAGTPHAVLFDAAAEAATSERTVRRSDPALGLEAVAVPVRYGRSTLAALA